MASEIETAWMAGLLEGEGCFVLDKRSGRIRLRVQLKMTDRDVIERAVRVFRSGGSICALYPRSLSSQVIFQVVWNGKEAEALMRAILPYMGNRRREKIRECLDTPNLSHYPRKAAA